MTIRTDQIANLINQFPEIMAWVAVLIAAIGIANLLYTMIKKRSWSVDPIWVIALSAFAFVLK